MTYKVKLTVFHRTWEVDYFKIHYYRNTDYRNNKPTSKVNGGNLELTIRSSERDDIFPWWQFLESADENYLLAEGRLDFYKDSFEGPIAFSYEFQDAFIVEQEERFSGWDNGPMRLHLIISAAIQRYKGVLFVKPWHKSPLPTNEPTPYRPVEDLTPQITAIDWIDKNEEITAETQYSKEVAIKVTLQNQQGGNVNLTITKKDGSEFEKGKKQLTFSESAKEGSILFSKFQIKDQWEEFKSVETDELLAQVTYNGQQKQSSALKITPKPKVTLHFRPHAAWGGEFGFDWMRIGDTSIDGDVDYKQNVGEYGNLYATSPAAVFTPKNYTSLENEYNPSTLHNKKDASGNPIQYYTPWLSIYTASNAATPPYAELELLTEVDIAPDELYLEFPKKYFSIAAAVDDPADANLQHYKLNAAMKGVTTVGNPNKTNIQLQCIHALPTDQTLKVWAARKKEDGTLDTPILSGMLTVKANDKAHRKIAKIVFVNVVTNINGARDPVNGINKANTILQENYLAPFLKQALVKPDIVNKKFELFDSSQPRVQRLHTDYTLSIGKTKIFHKYSNSGSMDLVNFLTREFNADSQFAAYKNHYKVFFLGDYGGYLDSTAAMGITLLGGYANGIPSKECVMYINPDPFFVAHELMHCMGLYHSFDNNGTHTFKIGQTENIMDYSHLRQYARPRTLTQISTWQWQWEILNKNNEQEP